ncbi:ATP-binding cassette domain-containing protein [Aliiroseovarius sediminis]|uniref:ABC transporter ATP-binding protein n=1 Tax=Aliiroseovarius sediminis TaxID=2925839 RepID=UPI001F590663|nr:ATP-binding cassette domain-containing protein [Aliiroseovarius sediminis]MCI2395959.1 ATP-binding cassette domain-containing protein [Aliiroseovarius sediminis]
MNVLDISDAGHAYLGRTILEGIDLSVAQGEIVALVGPSGCGKSTLAHIAAGLTEPRSGRITRHYARHAMIFQDPALMPWATSASNIDYALRLAGEKRRDRQARLAAVADHVALTSEDLTKYPVELSGGMHQRVAIARALSIQPDFIYFDEPFTALDVALRRRMQDLVIKTCADGNLSGLFITHDLNEAARLAHRVAILDTRGSGILGDRTPPGTPRTRTDAQVFDWVQGVVQDDPIFRHIHDVDERQIA